MNGVSAERFVVTSGKKRVAADVDEDTLQHIKVMLRQEEVYMPSSNYLDWDEEEYSIVQDKVNDVWRRKICEWSYEVVDHFSFDREAVAIALNYLDRVLAIKTEASGGPIPRREFQLVAVSSLYIATKLHGESDSFDGPRRKLKLSAFVQLSRGLFSEKTLEAMERGILACLQWRLNPPTTVRFVDMYLKLFPNHSPLSGEAVHPCVPSSIFEMARYLTELSVCASTYPFMFELKPSLVAYTAVLCSMEALQPSIPLSYDVRVQFLRTLAEAAGYIPQQEEVRECRLMIMEFCPGAFTNIEEIEEVSLTDSSASSCKNCHSPTESMFMSSSVPQAKETGKISPICVITDLENRQPSPDKRRRTESK